MAAPSPKGGPNARKKLIYAVVIVLCLGAGAAAYFLQSRGDGLTAEERQKIEASQQKIDDMTANMAKSAPPPPPPPADAPAPVEGRSGRSAQPFKK